MPLLPRHYLVRLAAALAFVLLLRVTADPVTVTLLNTGDIHEHTANLARIAAYVRQRKEQDPNTLFLDAGDVLNKGDLAIMATRGDAMFRLLGATGYDACILGNHGLSYGAIEALAVLRRYKLPVLDANSGLWGAELNPFPAYRVFQLKGVRVAVVGMSSEGSNHCCGPNVKRTRIHTAWEKLHAEVRAEADIVVMLTHVGSGRDRQVAKQMAKAGRAVDVIIGGHDHAAYKETTIEPESDTLIMHSGSFGRMLGEVRLVWDGERITERRSRLIPITAAMSQDEKVAKIRAELLAGIASGLEKANLEKPVAGRALMLWAAETLLAHEDAQAVIFAREEFGRTLPAGVLKVDNLLRAMPRLDFLTLRVPVAKLDELLQRLRLPGKGVRTPVCMYATDTKLPEVVTVLVAAMAHDKPAPNLKQLKVANLATVDATAVRRHLWVEALAACKAGDLPGLHPPKVKIRPITLQTP